MDVCRLCLRPAAETLLDFGPQPICNRFLAHMWEQEYRHRLALGVCRDCGLVQLVDPVPAVQLAPRFGWITYNEPEGHLDRVADTIARLPGLNSASAICGVTFKDDSTLRRLKERGFAKTWRIDPAADLGIRQINLGVESIQARLDTDTARGWVKSHGLADVVIARHIVEHAHDLRGFLQGLRALVQPNGYIVVEMPDARRALEQHDYSTVWEEHVCYFTPDTLLHGLRLAEFSLAHFEVFPYSLENSLLAIVQPGRTKAAHFPPAGVLLAEIDRATKFARALKAERGRYHEFFQEYRRLHGPVALLGAGHLACAFLNLLELSDYCAFVVDDDPHKQGLLMPGSRLPILGSAALLQRAIRLCLLTVAPESEPRVIQKNETFAQQGGRFASIFPESPYALRRQRWFPEILGGVHAGAAA